MPKRKSEGTASPAKKQKGEPQSEKTLENIVTAPPKLQKKLLSAAKDMLKNQARLTIHDAKALWTLALDGSGVTPNEFATLGHILQDEAIEFTDAARLHLHYLVTIQQSGTSMYKQVAGVKYDRSCLDLADHLSKDGKIDILDARILWGDVEDGPGVTATEKRTIEKVMEDKVFTAGATKFMKEQLASWSDPATASTPTPTPTATATATPPTPPTTPTTEPTTKTTAPKKTPPKTTAPKKPTPPKPKSAATPITPGERIELIVDRSGSMYKLLAATVAGLKSFLSQQQEEPGAGGRQVRLTTFNSDVQQPPEYHTSLSTVPIVTEAAVMPGGRTALLDSVGKVLSSVSLDNPCVVCIVTDGHENASQNFSQAQVNALIAERITAGWTFIFLAANQDAIASGEKFGIGPGSCATFSAAVDGISAAFQSAHQLASRSWKSTDTNVRSFTTNERAAMKTN